MSSSDDLRAWAEKYASVVQPFDAGVREPHKKLELAKRNLERARVALASGDPDQAVISAETAIVNAADAVIALSGHRLRGKTGSHQARFEHPALPKAFADERRVLDAARRARNTAQYDEFGSVPESLATDAIRVAAKLLAASQARVGAPED